HPSFLPSPSSNPDSIRINRSGRRRRSGHLCVRRLLGGSREQQLHRYTLKGKLPTQWDRFRSAHRSVHQWKNHRRHSRCACLITKLSFSSLISCCIGSLR
ncbi:unnamed protein product, partial [Linum tenue]